MHKDLMIMFFVHAMPHVQQIADRVAQISWDSFWNFVNVPNSVRETYN